MNQIQVRVNCLCWERRSVWIMAENMREGLRIDFAEHGGISCGNQPAGVHVFPRQVI